jgi:ABC-type Fe3+-hydroxamate transport system substrate-binding protein
LSVRQDAPTGPNRVVSLVPSMTETLLQWGVRPIAVTRFCEAPGIDQVGGTKNPDTRAIVALQPDLVLMDEEENRREDARALEAAGITVMATRIRRVSDVGPALAAVAVALGIGAPEVGVPEVGVPEVGVPESSVKVFVPIWRRPWMTVSGDTYGSSILAAAGFGNVYDDAAEVAGAYPEVDLPSVIARGPRFVLAPSEPYSFTERHRGELEQVAPVVFVDGQDLFWWGARTAGALERLGKLAAELRQR